MAMNSSARSKVRPLRALVIGAGPAPDAIHLPVLAALRDRGELVLEVVCDLQRERAAAARRKFGFIQDSGDVAAGLERKDIDLVYIFGSAQMHYEFGLRALQADKHLFVEKPIAASYAQALELATLARARGLTAVGGLNRRFTKALAAVRARAGGAGWRFAEAVFHKPEFGNPAPFGARTWLSANGIHGLDALLFMMGGLPEFLTAYSGDASQAAPNTFSALMRWSDGAQGTFLCNNNAGSRREEYTFHAAEESLSVNAAGVLIERKGEQPTSLALPMQGDGYAAEHAAFLEAVRTGSEPPHSLSAIAPSLHLAELIEGGFSGQVRLPPKAIPSPAPSPSSRSTILVVQPSELLAPLAQLLPRHNFVSLEDIRESPNPRPDVIAAILGRGSSPLQEEVLAKLPGLAIVGIVALSLARHEPEVLLARGIKLVNGSAAYADSVAEFALGLAILARRRAFWSDGVMKKGGWGTVPPVPGVRGLVQRSARRLRPALKAVGLESRMLKLWRTAAPLVGRETMRVLPPRDLQGATVGLIGWGANARAFTRLLAPSKARVVVYSQHGDPGDIRDSGAIPVSLDEALSADIVSLHRGLTAETRHCLGAAELARLRAGAVLINLARGALVEPTALLERLARGDIFACLDTFEDEPLIGPHALRGLPNVFLSSHIAGGSPDNYAAAALEVVRKVAAHLQGEVTDSISVARLRTMS